jgi:multidrug resistance efflux pump
MTWINRLRLFGGVLGVLIVVAALTLVFNQRQTKVNSLDATVATDTYDVGAAYGGTVIKQYVNDGDVVADGDNLFTIQSVPLQQDLANGLELTDNEAYDVDAKAGTLTYKATVAGQVTDLKAKLGNALGTGAPFAQISVVGSEYVDAKYLLSPRDYDRVVEGAQVDILLPNNQTVTGTVTTVRVATEEAQALTEVRVDSDELAEESLDTLTKTGTPVIATLHLRDDGPLAGVNDQALDFLRQIGLTS